MRKKQKENPKVAMPGDALRETFTSLPSAVKEEASDPAFWIALFVFIGFPTVYYVGTAVIFTVIPRTIWALFFS
jgi:hypothetical protein